MIHYSFISVSRDCEWSMDYLDFYEKYIICHNITISARRRILKAVSSALSIDPYLDALLYVIVPFIIALVIYVIIAIHLIILDWVSENPGATRLKDGFFDFTSNNNEYIIIGAILLYIIGFMRCLFNHSKEKMMRDKAAIDRGDDSGIWFVGDGEEFRKILALNPKVKAQEEWRLSLAKDRDEDESGWTSDDYRSHL